MNIIDIQDQLKNFSEEQLINEMQTPSGSAPQFLVLSEIQRRKRVRDDFNKRQAAMEPSVAQEAIAAAGVPQQGIAGMSEAMAPNSTMAQNAVGSVMSQPMRMNSGGILALNRGGPMDGSDSLTRDDVQGFLDEVEDAAETRFGLGSDGFGSGMSQKGGGFRRPTDVGGRMATPQPIDPSQFMNRPSVPNYSVGSRYVNQPTDSVQAGMSQKGGPNASGIGRFARFNNGGLVEGLFSGTDRGKQISERDYEIRTGKDGKKYVYKKGTNIMIGSADKLFDNKYDGGVLKAQAGAYFDPDGVATDELLRAIMMQESGGDPTARGSLDEVGAFQIRPGTALMPGYGAKSMFPDISSQIGPGKKYKNVQEAYEDNKELIDKGLSDVEGSRSFGRDYLTQLRKRAGSDEGAIAAYNRGLGGIKDVDIPNLDYVKGVKSYMGMSGDPSLDESASPDPFVPEGGTESLTDIVGGGKPAPKASADDLGDPEGDWQESIQIEQQNMEEAQEKESKEPSATAKPPATTEPEKLKDGADALAGALSFQSTGDGAEGGISAEIAELKTRLAKNAESDKWLALAQAGMALMSSKEPTLMGALGEAGISGLTAMREAQKRYDEGVIDLINAKAKIKPTGITESKSAELMSSIFEILGKTEKDPITGEMVPVVPAGPEREGLLRLIDALKPRVGGYREMQTSASKKAS